MRTIKHSNGTEVVVQQFSDLNEKVGTAVGLARAINSINSVKTQQDGIFREHLDSDRAVRAIVKKHNKFYGLTSKYDGRGNLRTA